MDIWAVIMQSPLAAWLGYIHLTRPARTECALRHEKVDGAETNLCMKLGELHTDIREIREILVGHVAKK